MRMNGINGVNTQTSTQTRQMGMSQANDSYSRNIQNQITNAQKQLQELSSNENMSAEEKMKKRQEIQQQISDLNMQLRQHQAELRRDAAGGAKKQQGSSRDAVSGGTGNAQNKSAGLSQTSMTAILSADNSMKQAKVQGSVAKSMEGRAGVLKAEIKTGDGGAAEKKKEELAEVEQKAQTAASSQLSTLAEANRTMEEAAREESRTDKTDREDAKTAEPKEKDAEEKVSGTGTQGDAVSGTKSADMQTDASNTEHAAAQSAVPQRAVYKSVDIRL